MIGDRLLLLRKNKKLTQAQIASLLNVSQQTYAKYENGTVEPNIDAINQLAKYFNVSTDYLLGNHDEPQPKFSIPDNLQEARVAFYGGVEGLKQEDIDKVAEYIEFLKSKGQ